MQRKVFLILVTVLFALILAACPAPTPPATQDSADNAVKEVSAEKAPAKEKGEESTNAVSNGEETTYMVDTAASSIVWTGTNPVRSSHTGTVDIAEGQLTLAGDQLVGSSFTIDMTTIHNTDLNEGDAADLVGHLLSDDFFGVGQYPTAMLTLKSAEPTDIENQYAVLADLTIKENTNEISFMTDVELGEETLTATADIVFDRAQFDVRYGSGSFFDNLGDKLINDEVELSVILVVNS